jgi:hypothetical protein
MPLPLRGDRPRSRIFLALGSEVTYKQQRADAAYIAAASPDVVLRLLDALDEARRERDEQKRVIDAHRLLVHWAVHYFSSPVKSVK